MKEKFVLMCLCALGLAASAAAATYTHNSDALFLAGSGDGNVVIGAGDGKVSLAKQAGTLGVWTSAGILSQANNNFVTWVQKDRIWYSSNGLGNKVRYLQLNGSGAIVSDNAYGDMPHKVDNIKVARWADRLYLAGGTANVANSNVVYVADLDVLGAPVAWRNAGTLPSGITYDSFVGRLAVDYGRLYYLASRPNGVYASSLVYSAALLPDGTLGAWKAESSRHQAGGSDIMGFNLAWSMGKIFAFGGETSSYAGESQLDQAAFSSSGSLSGWSLGTGLPAPRSWNAGSEVGVAGKLYQVGGKTGSGNVEHEDVYSNTLSSGGAAGAWTVETSLPYTICNVGVVGSQGRLFVIGGGVANGSAATDSIYSAALNQSSANAAEGVYDNRFDLGSDQALSQIAWSASPASAVQIQVRTAPQGGPFGGWTAFSSSPVALTWTARYLEYRVRFVDVPGQDVGLDTVTLTDLGGLTPTPTPTASPSPVPGSACSAVLPALTFGNGALPGDLVVSFKEVNALAGYHLSGPNAGTWYLYSDPATVAVPMPAGAYETTPDPLYPDRLIVTFEFQHRIGVLDSNGSYLGDWAAFSNNPGVPSFGPDGALYIGEVYTGVWRIPRGGSAALVPGSGPTGIVGLAFDAIGRLLLGDVLAGKVFRSTAAVSTLANSFNTLQTGVGNQQCRNVYDGNGGFYAISRNNQGTNAVSSLYHFDSSGVPTQFTDPSFSVNSLEGIAIDADGAIWMTQFNGTPALHGSVLFDQGLVRVDPVTSQATYVQKPASLGGLDLSAAHCNGLSVVGLPLPRPACGGSVSGYATATPTPTLTPTPATTCNAVLPAVTYGNGALPGDLVVTFKEVNTMAGYHLSGPNAGTWYLYSDPAVVATPLPGGVYQAVVDPLYPGQLVANFNFLDRIGAIDSNGSYLGDWATLPLSQPTGLAFGPDGALYAGDYQNGVWRIPRGGTATLVPGTHSKVVGLGFDASGRMVLGYDLTGTVERSNAVVNMAFNTFSTLQTGVGLQQTCNVFDGGSGFYATSRSNQSTTAVSSLYHFVDPSSVSLVTGSTFNDAALECAAIDANGLIWLVQFNGTPTLHGSVNFDQGLISVDPSGNVLSYIQRPASIGGLSLAGTHCNGVTVLGLPLPRPACGGSVSGYATATPSATPTITVTPSLTPIATGTMVVWAPTATATPSLTAAPPTVEPPAPEHEGEARCFPNPAHGAQTHFAYEMHGPGTARLKVWNAAGQLASNVEDHQGTGKCLLHLSIKDYAPGVYLYQLGLEYDDGRKVVGPVKRFAVVP